MMKKIFVLSVLGILLMSINSCEKKVIGDVEIFLLSEYERLENSHEIISGSEQLDQNPLITYDNIVSYDKDDFAFELTEEGQSVILENKDDLFGKAFAVTANGKIIYTGYFWSLVSSYAIDWLVIFSDFIELNHKISVKLGRASLSEDIDNRNSKEIINIFKRDNKLN